MTVSAKQAAAAIAEHPALKPAPRLAAVAAPAPGDPNNPPPLPTTTPSAGVVGNSIVSFTAALDATYATALSYALGYSQLQAVQNYGANPTTDPVGYYTQVTTILTNIGFVTENVDFSNFNTQTQTVELDTVVLEILGGLLTGDALLTATATLKALKADADDSGAPWQIWSSHSQSAGKGSFSLGAANETKGPDGSPHIAMDISAFNMQGTETSDKFLWMTYNSTQLAIQYGKTTMDFNIDLWDSPGVGDAITGAMQTHSKNYIAGLPPLKLT